MAFCERCGKELGPDGVCDCQKNQAAEANQTQASQVGADASAPGSRMPKLFQEMIADRRMLSAIGGIIALIFLIILFASSGDNYKKPLNDLVKLINKQSTDSFDYLEVSSPLLKYEKNAYNILKKNEDYREGMEDSKKALAECYEDLKGFKITKCDFVKAEKMKNKELRSIAKSVCDDDDYEKSIEEFEEMDKGDYEDLAEKLDISVKDAKKLIKELTAAYKAICNLEITDGYEVTLRFYAKFDGEEDKTDKIEGIKILKINGGWYIYNIGTLVRDMSFQDDLSDVSIYDIYKCINRLNYAF